MFCTVCNKRHEPSCEVVTLGSRSIGEALVRERAVTLGVTGSTVQIVCDDRQQAEAVMEWLESMAASPDESGYCE